MLDMNKVKPGDKVQIIPYDVLNTLVKEGKIRDYRLGTPGWNKLGMPGCCGKVVTIRKVIDIVSGCAYKVTGNGYTWKEEWLRPLTHHINIMEDGG